MPAYFGPWESAAWKRLLAARPAVVVINPASGPGDDAHAGYRELVPQFDAIGTSVLGYVTTSYLAKPFGECADEADRYREWYGVGGIFWDEIPAERARGRVRALRALVDCCRVASDRNGPVRCVFNPGRGVPRQWFGSLPGAVFVTFEGAADGHGLLDPVGPPERQCHLVHSAGDDPVEIPDGVGFAFVTADLPPNPWDVFD